jgi:cytochrome c-type biogenesis protein
MNTDINVLLAFVAGLLSFLSPCVLPLIPSYLSFVSGVSFQELSERQGFNRGVIMVRTAFFVLGFSIVFVVLGILFAGPALLFSGVSRWINLLAGFIVILLGFNVIFDFVQGLNLEKRMHVQKRPVTALGAVVVGMAFGAGWSPCIGPILASILFLAGSEGTIARAAVLLAVYSLGLGLPFLLAGAAFTRVSRSLASVKRYFPIIKTVSGAFLILIGLLIAFGRFQQLNGFLAAMAYDLRRWNAAAPMTARIVLGSLTLLVAFIHPVTRLIRRRPLLRPVGTTVSTILAAAGVAQLAGLLDLAHILAAWLAYQGV